MSEQFDVMVIASHPDDAELGMGGTIASLTELGKRVVIVDLTNGEPTPYGSEAIRAKESAEAARILGVTKRVTLDIKNREIFDTVENRKKVANVIREYRPKTLFLHYWDDGHPDHVQASALGVGSRFYAKFVKGDLLFDPHFPVSMYFFLAIHLRVKVHPSFVIDISSQFEKKLKSIDAYESQFATNPKNLGVKERVTRENAYWGSQIGVSYGEAFVSKEHIGFADPTVLV